MLKARRKNRLFLRFFDMVLAATTASYVVVGFTDIGTVLGRGAGFNLLLTIGVIGVIQSLWRVYYFDMKGVTPFHLSLPMAMDVAMALSSAASVAIAVFSKQISSCDTNAASVDPEIQNCDVLYVSLALGFAMSAFYIASFYWSYARRNVDRDNGAKGTWSLPKDRDPFFVRAAMIIIGIGCIGITASSTVARGRIDLIPSMFLFILAAAIASVAVSLAWMLWYDVDDTKKTPHVITEVLLHFNLALLCCSAGSMAWKNGAFDQCTIFQCTNGYVSAGLILFLAALHLFELIASYRRMTSDGSRLPALFGGTHAIADSTTLIARLLCALAAAVGFALALISIDDRNIVLFGPFNEWNAVVGSTFLCFAACIYLAFYQNLLNLAFPHAILTVGLEAVILALTGTAGAVTYLNQTCKTDENAGRMFESCDLWNTASLCCCACAMLLGVLIFFSFIQWAEYPNRQLKWSTLFELRIVQILLAIVLVSVTASVRGGHEIPRHMQILIGLGAVSTLLTCLWTYRYIIRGKELSNPLTAELYDILWGCLCGAGTANSYLSDLGKLCRDDPDAFDDCSQFDVAVLLSGLTSAAYGLSFIWSLLSNRQDYIDLGQKVSETPSADFVNSTPSFRPSTPPLSFCNPDDLEESDAEDSE